MKDALVVGLGLAGVSVAHALRSTGHSFTVVDVPLPDCGSPVAAGLMLPITGPRWVLRPHYQALLSAAERVYGPLMTPVQVNRLLAQDDASQLQKRRRDPAYQPYLSELKPPVDDATLDPFGRVCWPAHCLDVVSLLSRSRQRLKEDSVLVERLFSPDDVNHYSDHVRYQGSRYRYLILCTGHRAIGATAFEWLRYRPSHGEWCEFYPLQGVENGVYERRYWLHQEHDRTRFGSTYSSEALTAGTTDAGGLALLEAASTLVEPKLRIKQQYAGIRAAAIDWSPYLGTSPTHPRVALLAGLGSTGALLAPYCANALVDHLMHGEPLPAWLDLSRRERDRVDAK